jgi:hypothetical protein
MRESTPEDAKKLIQTLVDVRMKLSHPVMGGHDYYDLMDKIMENNNSQVTMYLMQALKQMENKWKTNGKQ